MNSFLKQLALLAIAGSSHAAVVSFEAADFGLNTTFSNVRTFSFEIDIEDSLAPGRSLDNPRLHGVDYNVFGFLTTTPSGFPAFRLERTIAGDEFYDQGSSLEFEIQRSADLSDGLQVSELEGTGTVFRFNGREVDTGRYHPSLVELNADGTGRILNSNNAGGVNPGSLRVVDVDFGEEYVTELRFDPSKLTLTRPIASVPEPSFAFVLLPLGFLGLQRKR